LTPEDLAASRHLVESHVTFLRHHLKRDRGPDGPESDEPEGTAPGQPTAAVLPALGDRAVPSADLEARLQAAIDAGDTLELTYADTQAQVTHRRVRPLHLLTRRGRAYLLAFCELRQDERHFRLDRIVEVKR
jgi:predicted DNA-binding transcriptional regulator YafY